MVCPRTLPTNRSIGSFPSLIPAHEWRVTPPILRAAIPVEAVTATASGEVSRRSFIISRKRTDFPVPVDHQLSCCLRRSLRTGGACKENVLPLFDSSNNSMLLRREQDFELGLVTFYCVGVIIFDTRMPGSHMDGGSSGFCCGGFVNRVTTKYFVQLTSEPSFGLLLRTEAVVQGIGITVDL